MRPIMRLSILLAIIMFAAGLAPQARARAQQSLADQSVAASGQHARAQLAPLWSSGLISRRVGPAIFVEDVNQDSSVDIIGCSDRALFVLNKGAGAQYSPAWYDDSLDCFKLALGDRDGNGRKEIYVATGDDRVLVFDTAPYAQVAEIHAPDGLETTTPDIAVGNVDADPALEIILTRPNATLVYDALSLALEWQVPGVWGYNVALGDVSGDAGAEIVLGSEGRPGYVLDARTRTELWSRPQGFGILMEVGNVDADPRDEIVFYTRGNINPGITVLEAGAQEIQREIAYSGGSALKLADADLDGVAEIFVGDSQWKGLDVFRGSDGQQLDSAAAPAVQIAMVTGIGVGNVDDDAEQEVVYAAGDSGNWSGILLRDWNGEPALIVDDPDGFAGGAVGDVDADGDVELLLGSTSVSNGYKPATLIALDADSHLVEWTQPITPGLRKLGGVELAQLDADPALEIVALAYRSFLEAHVQVYDGLTRALEWQSDQLPVDPFPHLLVHNMDSDPLDEVLVWNESKVWQFALAGSSAEWSSGTLAGKIKDLFAGDLDGDDSADLALLTSQHLYLIEPATATEHLAGAFANGDQIALIRDADGQPQLLILSRHLHYDYFDWTVLQSRSPLDLSLRWARLLGLKGWGGSDLQVGDVEADGDEEFLLSVAGEPTLLTIGSLTGASHLVEYEQPIGGEPVVADVDEDGVNEVVAVAGRSVTVYALESSAFAVSQAYLPYIPNSTCSDFSDDFSDPRVAWLEDSTMGYRYVDGEYSVTGYGIYGDSIRQPIAPGCPRFSYEVSVDVRWTGTAGTGYGLVFAVRPDHRKFGLLQLDAPSRQFYIVFPAWDVPDIGPIRSTAIRTGTAGNRVKLSVEREHAISGAVARNRLTVWINGSLAGSWVVSGVDLAGAVGLRVSARPDLVSTEARFDNFVVRSLPDGSALDELALPAPALASQEEPRLFAAPAYESER